MQAPHPCFMFDGINIKMDAAMKEKQTHRVQLELPERSFARLKALRTATEAVSYAEVIRSALRLYEAAVAETNLGGAVFVRRKDRTEQAIFATGGIEG